MTSAPAPANQSGVAFTGAPRSIVAFISALEKPLNCQAHVTNMCMQPTDKTSNEEGGEGKTVV